MPKRTKKEKVIAEFRRKLTTFREQPAATLHTTTDIQPVDRLVRRDLIKTLLLAAIAIGGEVAISMMIK